MDLIKVAQSAFATEIKEHAPFKAGDTITVTYKINGGADLTVNIDASSTATVAAPTAVAGDFIYSLVSADYQTAPSCTNVLVGSATVTVLTCTELTLTAATSGVVCLNGIVNLTLTLTNYATVPANNITVTDVLASEFTYTSSTATKGSYDNLSSLWMVGNLAVGESVTLTISVSGTTAGVNILKILQVTIHTISNN